MSTFGKQYWHTAGSINKALLASAVACVHLQGDSFSQRHEALATACVHVAKDISQLQTVLSRQL